MTRSPLISGIALDSSINIIDTANLYAGGMSETIVGQALKDLEVDRAPDRQRLDKKGHLRPTGELMLGTRASHCGRDWNESRRRR
jgi:aryl-alcohol dehydrogenase-like predicted oxidoreductase